MVHKVDRETYRWKSSREPVSDLVSDAATCTTGAADDKRGTLRALDLGTGPHRQHESHGVDLPGA